MTQLQRKGVEGFISPLCDRLTVILQHLKTSWKNWKKIKEKVCMLLTVAAEVWTPLSRKKIHKFWDKNKKKSTGVNH